MYSFAVLNAPCLNFRNVMLTGYGNRISSKAASSFKNDNRGIRFLRSIVSSHIMVPVVKMASLTGEVEVKFVPVNENG